jgi:predicted DNA-binding transcriptional regulator YafY
MRRADRLFQIIQILRRSSRQITADEIARELEVSPRTVYRDVADLIGQRVPIRGEAGFGYVLDDDFSMPPLMLTADELEAAVLGAQWVAGRGDEALARAANDLIAKITAAVPERLRPLITAPSIGTRPSCRPVEDGLDITQTRLCIREGRKILLHYRTLNGEESRRVIWPVIIGYFEHARMLAGWCELRQDFRHFRTDRVFAAEFLAERHGSRPGELRHRWKRHMAEKQAEKQAARAPAT